MGRIIKPELIRKPTRREFLKYAGIGVAAFGVPMLLKIREAQAAVTRGVGPLYITVAGTSNTGTLNSVTAGRSLVFVLNWYDPAGTTTVTIDVAGQSATLIPGSKYTNTLPGNTSGQIAILANVSGSGDKLITITCSISTTLDAAIMEYDGLDTASQPDASTSAVGGDPATLTLTTTTANALIVAGAVNNGGGEAAGSGYTLFGGSGMPNTNYYEEAEDQLDMGATGSKTVAFGGYAGTNWSMTAASFKAAGGGGGGGAVRHRVTQQ